MASELGLVENSDFILGTTDETLNSLNRLEFILRNHTDTHLFVYNSDIGEVRKIVVSNPDRRNLGCGVGEGVFHAIDKAERDKIKAEKLEEQKDEVEKTEEVVVTVLQKKPDDLPPPPRKNPEAITAPPIPSKIETKNGIKKQSEVLKLLPPPSIYDLNNEKSSFQANILNSKFIIH